MQFLLTVSSLLFVLALASCQRRDAQNIEIQSSETRPLTMLDRAYPLNANSMQRFTQVADSPFILKAQENWIEVPPGQFASNRFQVDVAELTVSMVSGGLLENFNRWQGQFSQPSLTPEQLAALPNVQILGRPAKLSELKGKFSGMRNQGAQELDNWGMLGTLLELPNQQMISVKMTGPADVIALEKEKFKVFCATLQVKTQTQPETEQP